ncbi:uncharacterized protein LOC100578666 isoform X1 [Apis mellifera]|uniref:Uncharacterized protein LOC100578666 isoform X1 n=1 Tax=Apis mellifera TaxID=7460 RepID=A0A7M7IGP7_APIME|nr:uncharacterized protein LOC100578666 isoform X1 [Apis mellifera]|eukprot:XP_016766964.1 uncharacterized protein LOC100578666 isoform X1 [Apis mellifera]
MKLTAWNFVLCILVTVFFLAVTTSAYPASNPEIMYNLQAIENMRQIPQWHCLRYRKFDLVRRCRNYRLGRKH